MLLEKEYPATHSMSTAWYLVDEEDNVGIMDFGDNGPVPYGIPSLLSLEDLALGGLEDIAGMTFHIRFTDEQLEELVGKPLPLTAEHLWGYLLITVAPEREQELVRLCQESWNTRSHEGCLIYGGCLDTTKRLHLLFPSACTTTDSPREFIPGNPLEEAIHTGLIERAYQLPLYDMDFYIAEDGKEVRTSSVAHSPFYLYHEPYCEQCLQQRMHVPQHPVKLQQVAPELRERFFRIPHKFADLPQMQIARHIPAYASVAREDRFEVGDRSFFRVPDEGGGFIYCPVDPAEDEPRHFYTEAEIEALIKQAQSR